jgi:hypothetical protein
VRRIVLSFIVRAPTVATSGFRTPLNLEDMVEIYSADQAHQINDIPTLIDLFHSHRRRAYLRQNAPTWAERSFWEHCGRWPKDDWYLGLYLAIGRHPPKCWSTCNICKKVPSAWANARTGSSMNLRKNAAGVAFSGWQGCEKSDQP